MKWLAFHSSSHESVDVPSVDDWPSILRKFNQYDSPSYTHLLSIYVFLICFIVYISCWSVRYIKRIPNYWPQRQFCQYLHPCVCHLRWRKSCTLGPIQFRNGSFWRQWLYCYYLCWRGTDRWIEWDSGAGASKVSHLFKLPRWLNPQYLSCILLTDISSHPQFPRKVTSHGQGR